MKEIQGFILDCLHSEQEGDIHYNVYIPDSYDGTKEYALYAFCQLSGLYFQGVENIRTEDFWFEHKNTIRNIIFSTVNDWWSIADQAIELTYAYLLEDAESIGKYIVTAIPAEELQL